MLNIGDQVSRLTVHDDGIINAQYPRAQPETASNKPTHAICHRIQNRAGYRIGRFLCRYLIEP